MGHSSFVLKGRAVTLVAVALLLKGSTHRAWVAWIPLLVFWYLDAYFLLRLLPPYGEHLSQAFARFFMRVGLPVDIPPFK